MKFVMPKEKWGPGEWEHEPDTWTWTTDSHPEYRMRGIRGPTGAWCGYLDVPKGHPWFGVDYDNLAAEVHGGLTFSGQENGGFWSVGFDCSHGFDYMPAHEAIMHQNPHRYSSPFPKPPMFPPETYKTMEYVQNECHKLLFQAVEAANAQK